MSDTAIHVPELGDSVSAGVVGRWLKDVGEAVRKGEPLVELQSDKVNLEVEAPADGVLATISVQEGESAEIGAELGRIGAEVPQETPPAVDPAPETPLAPEPALPPTPIRDVAAKAAESAEPQPQPPPARPPRRAAAATPARAHDTPALQGVRLVSPAAKRLIEQYGLAIETLEGTGMGGSIRAADVQAHVGTKGAAPTSSPRPRAPARGGAAADKTAPTAGEDRMQALTPIRKAIATAMTRSRSEIPDAWSTVEIDMSRATERRARLKEEFDRLSGVNLTFLALFAEAVVQGLRAVPKVNSTWSEEGILLHGPLNLGIAVAGPRGLVVPVVHNAERLSLEGLAVAINDAVAKGRADKLVAADLQNGTFTINNAGALGSIYTQAIPVPGQAGIVTMESIIKRVVALSDNTIAIRPMMNCTLSFDHRIIDGAEALQFLGAAKTHLEQSI